MATFWATFSKSLTTFLSTFLVALKRTANYQMSDSVEKMEAEWPGDDQLCAEYDGHAKLKALKTKI